MPGIEKPDYRFYLFLMLLQIIEFSIICNDLSAASRLFYTALNAGDCSVLISPIHCSLTELSLRLKLNSCSLCSCPARRKVSQARSNRVKPKNTFVVISMIQSLVN